MKNLKSHFKFNKQERSGIFFLLLVIVLLQFGYFAYRTLWKSESESIKVSLETQTQIDVLKSQLAEKDTIRIFPFNPNFITDYKGYTLGMSVTEIDRLLSFRKQGNFANSPEEFQKVTQISDSLLAQISPYFKFPEWTQKSKQSSISRNQYKVGRYDSPSEKSAEGIRDLNLATAEDLKTIYGIGEKLSARIIKFRNRLGGFLIDDQLYDVYGLEPDVVKRTLGKFKVVKPPEIKKINVNSASVEELQKLIYLQKRVAIGIVNYRNDNGTIVSFDELITVEGFPAEKIDRLALYLSLN